MTRRLSVVAITIAATMFAVLQPVLAAGAPGPLTAEQRLRDFDYLVKAVTENYPHLWSKQRLTGIDWTTRIPDFRKAIEASPDDASFLRTMRKLVGGLQNSHTSVLTEDWLSTHKTELDKMGGYEAIKEAYARFAPAKAPASAWSVTITYGAGGYWVSRSRLPEVPVGSNVLAIDGVDVDTYARRQVDRAVLLVDRQRKQLYVRELPLPEGERMVLTLKEENRNPKPVLVPTTVAKGTEEAPPAAPNFTGKVLEPGKTAYMRVKGFGYGNIEKDAPAIKDFLSSVTGFETLIIDIRGNGGGADAYWRNLLVAPLLDGKKTLVRRYAFRSGPLAKAHMKSRLGMAYYAARERKSAYAPKALPPELKGNGFAEYVRLYDTIKPTSKGDRFKGKIKLLVDDGVYSSAESLAWFAKATGWATLVGTTTGGDGAGVDPMLFVLPNSKLVVRMSPGMGLNPDGSSNEENKTEPDVLAELTPSEIRARLVTGSADVDPANDNVIRTAMGQSAVRATVDATTVNTTVPKYIGAGLTVYPGHTMEPGVKLTVTPPYAGEHSIGAVVDTKYFKPGAFYTGKRYFMGGLYLFGTAGYTVWPGIDTENTDQPVYGLEYGTGLRWVSENGQSTARFGLVHAPAESIPAFQQVTDDRTELVASALTTVNSKDTRITLFGKWSKDLLDQGSLMGGAEVDYRLAGTGYMHMGLAGATSDRSHEYSIDDNTGFFGIPGTKLDFTGNQAIKGTAGLRYRPLITAGFLPTPTDFWYGPHVDIGWVGDNSTKKEFNSVTAGLSTSLTLGTPADNTSLAAGIAVPIKRDTGVKFYAKVSASIF